MLPLYHRSRFDSPDDENRGARNMQRIGINTYEKIEMCVKLAIYKNWTDGMCCTQFAIAQDFLDKSNGIKNTHIIPSSSCKTMMMTLSVVCFSAWECQCLQNLRQYRWRSTQHGPSGIHNSVCKIYDLTLRLLMSYIYGAPILDVSRSHTTTQHSR